MAAFLRRPLRRRSREWFKKVHWCLKLRKNLQTLRNHLDIRSQHQVPQTGVKQHPKTPKPTKTYENPFPNSSMQKLVSNWFLSGSYGSDVSSNTISRFTNSRISQKSRLSHNHDITNSSCTIHFAQAKTQTNYPQETLFSMMKWCMCAAFKACPFQSKVIETGNVFVAKNVKVSWEDVQLTESPWTYLNIF